MKKRILSLLLALCLLPLTACGEQWDDRTEDDTLQTLMEFYQPVDEGKDKVSPLTGFALPYFEGHTMDPVTCPDGPHQVLGALLYQGLFALDPQFVPQKVLTESWDYNSKTYTYTIRLKEGVKFSDGSDLTADDVVSTLLRAQASKRYGQRLKDVSSIDGSGHLVEITLKRDNAAFVALLDIPIVKDGTQDEPVPLGSGPYVPAKKDGKRFLQPSEYWSGPKLPLKRIDLVRCKDADTMSYAFYAREVQLLVYDLTASTSTNVYGSGSYTDAATTTLHYIGVNTRREPLNSAQLRRALSLGIDRSGCVSAYLLGHGSPAQFPLSPASALYPEKLDVTYSPDNFDSAMKKAGYAKGKEIPLTLIVNQENPFKVDASKKIAVDLSRHDVKITVKVLPWDEYLSALRNGRFDLYYGECRLGADWNLRPLLTPGGSLNYGGYDSKQTTQLVDRLLTAPSKNRSLAAEALCKNLATQAPILPICFKNISVLLPSGAVDKITPTAADPFYQFENWKIHFEK